MPAGNTPEANSLPASRRGPSPFTVARMLSQVAGYVGGVVRLARRYLALVCRQGLSGAPPGAMSGEDL